MGTKYSREGTLYSFGFGKLWNDDRSQSVDVSYSLYRKEVTTGSEISAGAYHPSKAPFEFIAKFDLRSDKKPTWYKDDMVLETKEGELYSVHAGSVEASPIEG